jgi:hypothetical protein
MPPLSTQRTNSPAKTDKEKNKIGSTQYFYWTEPIYLEDILNFSKGYILFCHCHPKYELFSPESSHLHKKKRGQPIGCPRKVYRINEDYLTYFFLPSMM